MALNAREIAEAFSGHNFAVTYPHLAEDIIWRMPGSEDLHGRDAVIAACESTTEGLTDTQIHSERFFVVDAGDNVAVETRTRYDDAGIISTVASCDIYEFDGAMINQITSYTVEV